VYRSFEEAVKRAEQGERLKLALFKDRECYSLSTMSSDNPSEDQDASTGEVPLEQGCM
jgi:hypothetical protein